MALLLNRAIEKPSRTRPGAGGLFLCFSIPCILVFLLLTGVAGCGPIPPPPVRGADVASTVAEPPEPGPAAVSPAPVPPEPATAKTDLGIPGVFHEVQPGQTVWRIAKTYGVSLDLLAQINELEDPTVIDAGQRLYIPGASRLLEVEVFQPQNQPAEERTEDLQLQWPVTGTITSRFGGRRRHTGLDIAAPRNTPVLAAADGEVTYSGNGLRGYGNLVVVDHGQGVVTLYAHNRRNIVRKGDRVKRGEKIARVGSTGHSTGPHVHFEVQIDGKRVDPQHYLD